MVIPVLIPLRHLDGFHVWIGNDLAGTCWRDNYGHRWHVRWSDHSKRFIFGRADDFPGCVTAIVDGFNRA